MPVAAERRWQQETSTQLSATDAEEIDLASAVRAADVTCSAMLPFTLLATANTCPHPARTESARLPLPNKVRYVELLLGLDGFRLGFGDRGLGVLSRGPRRARRPVRLGLP